MTELYLISGFLGAGKTTLLQKLLREGFAGQKAALVENDFGAVSLDAKLLKSGGYTVQELRAGCICCTLNGNFVSALVSLLRRVQPDVVLIEPSGVAKLSDVEALCRDQRLAALAVLKQKITVVDAANCASYCENFGAFFGSGALCRHVGVQPQRCRNAADRERPPPCAEAEPPCRLFFRELGYVLGAGHFAACTAHPGIDTSPPDFGASHAGDISVFYCHGFV